MNHVSELSVDKYLAGEMSRESAAMLREHAATCTRCNESLDHALQTRDAFEFVSPHAATRKRWFYAAPVVLAAACAMLLVWPKPREPQVRTKGTAIVGFFVAHGGAVRRGALAETVAPGDRLELVTSTTENGYFSAISTDMLGARSVYVPLVAIAAGREQAVPGAVELDAQLGRETVTGVFCAASFDPLTIDLTNLPAGCTADRFTLDKK